MVADYRALIRDEVERDTRQLSTYEAFLKATADEPAKNDRNGREIGLRTFADKRRDYLLHQTDPAASHKAPNPDARDTNRNSRNRD